MVVRHVQRSLIFTNLSSNSKKICQQSLHFALCARSTRPTRSWQHARNLQTNPHRNASRYATAPASTWRMKWAQKWQQARKENPIWLSVSVFSVFLSIGIVIYTFVIYPRRLARDFDGFPDSVAAKLRLALWYSTDRHFDAEKALKCYKEANILAQKHQMDPYGDQYFGMRLKLAGLLEKMELMEKAIEILEQERVKYLKAVEVLSTKSGHEERRTQILFKTVALNAKLAEYYSHAQVNNDEAAEERLTWSVTTIFKEQERRRKEGIDSQTGGRWISNEETGATLEALANFYESKDRHYLSVPLYLQALAYSPSSSCHTIVLMNNLAISLALQRPPESPHTPLASATDQISSSRSWVRRALKTAEAIVPPQRTSECDEGCATATINLGDLALMEGNQEEARRMFEEGKAMSKKVGYNEGIKKADNMLKQLDKRKERT